MSKNPFCFTKLQKTFNSTIPLNKKTHLFWRWVSKFIMY
jgi:hypothetical protein